MKLSTRARYALRMALDIARHGNEETPVSLGDVAKRTELSRGYLEQLAMVLRSASLVRGVAGKQGGYFLCRPPADITLLDIIEAAIGPVAILDCLGDPDQCALTGDCECRLVYMLINRRITEVFADYTLADLADPKWAGAMERKLSGLDAAKAGRPPRACGA
jgi:Rrf2 family cysteine metabolism transcriptional repressor